MRSYSCIMVMEMTTLLTPNLVLTAALPVLSDRRISVKNSSSVVKFILIEKVKLENPAILSPPFSWQSPKLNCESGVGEVSRKSDSVASLSPTSSSLTGARLTRSVGL